MHHRQEKNKKTRTDAADPGRIPGYQEHIEHQICKKKTLIPKVKSEKGETVTSRKGIANVFGKFHSKLYAEERLDEEEHDPHRSETRTSKRGRSGEEEEKKEIPEFTKKKGAGCHRQPQKGKTSDSNGIRARDIKAYVTRRRRR